MLFERQKPGQTADERLAQLLSERPIRTSFPDVKHRPPYDLCRALVIALLLMSVVGTWSVAYFM